MTSGFDPGVRQKKAERGYLPPGERGRKQHRIEDEGRFRTVRTVSEHNAHPVGPYSSDSDGTGPTPGSHTPSDGSPSPHGEISQGGSRKGRSSQSVPPQSELGDANRPHNPKSANATPGKSSERSPAGGLRKSEGAEIKRVQESNAGNVPPAKTASKPGENAKKTAASTRDKEAKKAAKKSKADRTAPKTGRSREEQHIKTTYDKRNRSVDGRLQDGSRVDRSSSPAPKTPKSPVHSRKGARPLKNPSSSGTAAFEKLESQQQSQQQSGRNTPGPDPTTKIAAPSRHTAQGPSTGRQNRREKKRLKEEAKEKERRNQEENKQKREQAIRDWIEACAAPGADVRVEVRCRDKNGQRVNPMDYKVDVDVVVGQRIYAHMCQEGWSVEMLAALERAMRKQRVFKEFKADPKVHPMMKGESTKVWHRPDGNVIVSVGTLDIDWELEFYVAPKGGASGTKGWMGGWLGW